MSAAVVSGAVALMLQQNPQLTPDLVKYRLMKNRVQGLAGGNGVYRPFDRCHVSEQIRPIHSRRGLFGHNGCAEGFFGSSRRGCFADCASQPVVGRSLDGAWLGRNVGNGGNVGHGRNVGDGGDVGHGCNVGYIFPDRHGGNVGYSGDVGYGRNVGYFDPATAMVNENGDR